jgi:hypothetical protein
MFSNQKTEIFLDGFEDFLLVLNKGYNKCEIIENYRERLSFWTQKIQNITSFFIVCY